MKHDIAKTLRLGISLAESPIKTMILYAIEIYGSKRAEDQFDEFTKELYSILSSREEYMKAFQLKLENKDFYDFCMTASRYATQAKAEKKMKSFAYLLADHIMTGNEKVDEKRILILDVIADLNMSEFSYIKRLNQRIITYSKVGNSIFVESEKLKQHPISHQIKYRGPIDIPE